MICNKAVPSLHSPSIIIFLHEQWYEEMLSCLCKIKVAYMLWLCVAMHKCETYVYKFWNFQTVATRSTATSYWDKHELSAHISIVLVAVLKIPNFTLYLLTIGWGSKGIFATKANFYEQMNMLRICRKVIACTLLHMLYTHCGQTLSDW